MSLTNILQNGLFNVANEIQKRTVLSRQQIEIGIEPVLTYVPPPMTNFIKTPLEHPKRVISKIYGKDFSDQAWMNYFSAAGSEKITGEMKRFDPNHRMYQVWVGTYMIKNNFEFGLRGNKPVFKEIAIFPFTDQSTWINGAIGISEPTFKVYDVHRIESLHENSVADYSFKILSSTDALASNKGEPYLRMLMPGVGSKKGIEKEVELQTVMSVLKKDDVLIMPYGCATTHNWENKGMEQEIKKMIRSIEFKKVHQKNMMIPWEKLSDIITRDADSLLEEKL